MGFGQLIQSNILLKTGFFDSLKGLLTESLIFYISCGAILRTLSFNFGGFSMV